MLAEEIKKFLDSTPFQPFALRMADGREYPVLTLDHIYFPPNSRQIFVTDDEGLTAALPTSYITGLVYTEPSTSANKPPSES